MSRDPAVEAYVEAAASWDRDRADQLARSARRAWRVAGAAALVAAAAVAAVAALTPLKSVEPFLVRVDNSTGIVDVMPRFRGEVEWPEAVRRHLLNLYVAARERYVAEMAEADYQWVGAHQNAPLNQAWLQQWARDNPDSPLVRYRDGSTVAVQVTSISFLERAGGTQDLAQVRFRTHLKAGGSGAEQVSYWIATLQYTFAPPSEDSAIRALNPLGLKVLAYRREPELVGVDPRLAAAGNAP
jgi:type IV secretion system protein VirB8